MPKPRISWLDEWEAQLTILPKTKPEDNIKIFQQLEMIFIEWLRREGIYGPRTEKAANLLS